LEKEKPKRKEKPSRGGVQPKGRLGLMSVTVAARKKTILPPQAGPAGEKRRLNVWKLMRT